MTAQTNKLDLGKHDVGYEWQAGSTPPGDSAPGRWVVRLTDVGWVVLFKSNVGTEYPIHTFQPDGEKVAKVLALRVVDIAWGREPSSK